MSSNTTPATATKRRSHRSSAETREHVLAVAEQLFYWDGIRATGVDKVASEAGVAATTLYRLFDSKDDLVAAYLERGDRGYKDFVGELTTPKVGSARERIISLFEGMAEQIGPENCRGCPFLMALAEYPDPQSPPHKQAVATKQWVRETITALTRELNEATPVADAERLADHLALLIEGVYGSVQALSSDGPAANATSAAEALIDAARL